MLTAIALLPLALCKMDQQKIVVVILTLLVFYVGFLYWTIFLAFTPDFILLNHINCIIRRIHELVGRCNFAIHYVLKGFKAIPEHCLRGVEAVMPSARGRRVRIADEEQVLIYDPESPVSPERAVLPSAAQDTFESLLDEVRRFELSPSPLHRDGYRSRYAPAGSAPRPIDREQPSLQEFLNSSEDHFPASGTDIGSPDIGTNANALKDDINTSRSTSAYNTFRSKENVQSPLSPSAANTLGLQESVKPSGSPSTVNTSEPKENFKPSGSPSFTTLRHKLSSILRGEASGRDDNRSPATPPMPGLPGNIATTPIQDSGVFRLNNHHGQTTQIQANSADIARPAAMASPTMMGSTATVMSSTDTASPTNIASSATMASPVFTGSPLSTSDFAAKANDKATRRKPLLTIDTTQSNKSAPTSTTSSSAYGQSRSHSDEYGSPKIREGVSTRPGPTDALSLNSQEAYEDEVPIYTRSHPIVNEFEAAYLEEAFEVSSTTDLIATGETSTAITEPASSFMSPTKLGKALRRNFANLKLPKPESIYSRLGANKGAAQSPKLAGSNASESVYRNWDANKGTIRSPGESSVPQANLYRDPMYPQPPSPEISRFRQASTSSRNIQHTSGPTATTGATNTQTSPTSPGQFRVPRKSVGPGDVRVVSDGKKLQQPAPSSSQEESSTAGAQERAKAKAKMEREDFVAFKVNELRERTGSQVVWYSPNDLRCRHPNHPRTWYSKNLWCATHKGACANCGAPCCAMAGAIKIVEENLGPATAVAAAKNLSQAIGLYVAIGKDESTLMECTSCHRLVCPECCSVCPVGPCGDRVCNAPGCNPDRQWEICDLHDE